MFTGLIRYLGEVADVPANPDEGGELRIHAAELSARPGDSIAVNGACLTLTGIADATFAFDVMPTTFRATALAELSPGDRVNLEPALRAGDPLGGHIVQGHVDGVAEVAEVQQDGNSVLLWIKIPADLEPLVVARGSICLQGVSLTVSGRTAGLASVSLIPETRARTTFSQVSPGDRLNLEVDILARYVAEALATRAESG